MGLDTQLIDDGTYFVVETEGVIAGCGGWSRRATRFMGATKRRDVTLACSTLLWKQLVSERCTPTRPSLEEASGGWCFPFVRRPPETKGSRGWN